MSKAEHTRQFIIEKSATIFNKKGYNGTSLADLTEATGLSKGSIYGNFENKDEVAKAVFEYNVDCFFKEVESHVVSQQSASDQLRAFLDFYRSKWVQIFKNGGCPILNASIEADDNLPFLKDAVKRSVLKWSDILRNILNKGMEEGLYKSGVSFEDYAYLFISLIEGGIMLSKICNDQGHLMKALDRIEQIIKEEISK